MYYSVIHIGDCCCPTVGVTMLHGHDGADGFLLAGVEVRAEVGEAGLGAELPDVGDQVLAHVQGVDGVCLAVGILLLILLQVVLGWSKQLVKVDAFTIGCCLRTVALLTVILKLIVIVLLVAGVDLIIDFLNDLVDLIDQEFEQFSQERDLGPLLLSPAGPGHPGLGVDLVSLHHDLVEPVVVVAHTVLQQLGQGSGAHLHTSRLIDGMITMEYSLYLGLVFSIELRVLGDPLRHDEVQRAVAGGARHVGQELQHRLLLRVEQLRVHLQWAG